MPLIIHHSLRIFLMLLKIPSPQCFWTYCPTWFYCESVLYCLTDEHCSWILSSLSLYPVCLRKWFSDNRFEKNGFLYSKFWVRILDFSRKSLWSLHIPQFLWALMPLGTKIGKMPLNTVKRQCVQYVSHLK